MFPSCVVTRSRANEIIKNTEVDLDSLDKLFPSEALKEIVEESGDNSSGESQSFVDIGDVPVTRRMLVEALGADSSLSNLLDRAVSEANSED